MDTTASGDGNSEIPMDIGEATGGAESGLTGEGEGESSSRPDFPWPFGSGRDSGTRSARRDEPKEESTQRAQPPGTVSVSSDTFNMNHKRRGKALIINQENFSSSLKEQGFGQRVGTNVDAKNLRFKLEALGFKVEPYNDLKAASIRNIVSRAAAEDHTDADCFVCVILSHGEEGIVFGTDKPVDIKDLAAYFKGDNCPGLVGKPKLFIIQACRGYQTDEGVAMNVADALPMEEDETSLVPPDIKLPVEADFLFAYSTVPGYYSWRNGLHGSWFVQALTEMLDKFGETMEIQKLLTKVHQMVAQNFESQSNQPGFYKKKQVPSMVSMLTKDVYFRKKPKRQR